ncbi:hypothetical protein A2U01_0081964, partial [Trifolium medium]|nr:hypothetical protein [Trifolium medium]
MSSLITLKGMLARLHRKVHPGNNNFWVMAYTFQLPLASSRPNGHKPSSPSSWYGFP